MKNLLLVDFNNIVYRALHANTGLSFAGKFTGGVFGFIKMLSKQINDLAITNLIVCKDSKPYDRILDYPDYKGDRKKDNNPDFLKMQKDSFKYITLLLEILGVQVIEKPGVEADDLVAILTKKYSKKYNFIYLMSNDSDLYQLFCLDNVKMIKKGGLYGCNEFKHDFEIEPGLWPCAIAIAGSHNGVPGIKKGIGIKTALKFIKTCETKQDVMEYASGKYSDILERNIQLATLPYKDYKIRMPLKTHYHERKMLRFCASLGIGIPGFVCNAFKSVTHKKLPTGLFS